MGTDLGSSTVFINFQGIGGGGGVKLLKTDLLEGCWSCMLLLNICIECGKSVVGSLNQFVIDVKKICGRLSARRQNLVVLVGAVVVQQVAEVAVVVVPQGVVLEVGPRDGGQVDLSKETGTKVGTRTSTSRAGVGSRIGTRVATATGGASKVRVS